VAQLCFIHHKKGNGWAKGRNMPGSSLLVCHQLLSLHLFWKEKVIPKLWWMSCSPSPGSIGCWALFYPRKCIFSLKIKFPPEVQAQSLLEGQCVTPLCIHLFTHWITNKSSAISKGNSKHPFLLKHMLFTYTYNCCQFSLYSWSLNLFIVNNFIWRVSKRENLK
jgi:hypothetical protein